MEKETKGLFRRMLDFWKEKIGAEETVGIGFPHEKERESEHFADRNAVGLENRKERKKIFSEDMAEEGEWKRKRLFAEPEAEAQHRKETRLFSESAKIFRKEETAEERMQPNKMIFLQEDPVTERKERQRIPVLAEGEKPAEASVEKESLKEIHFAEREVQKEAEVDVEKLMRQITKKLWEEREGCGRRLR